MVSELEAATAPAVMAAVTAVMAAAIVAADGDAGSF